LSVLLATLNAMPSELPPHLRELAQFQQGILTSAQARQGGLTKDVIRSRVRQGRWQRVQAGVYAVFSGEPGRAAVLWAAVLRAGPGAMLSHHTAAELAALARCAGRNEYRDVLYEEYGVAVELDGRAAHPGDLRWRDIRRDNSAAAAGLVTLRYGWIDVSQRPCWVAAQVAQVLARRGYSGCRPCAPGCPVAMIR
jgi:hypothetical protein